MRLIVYVPGYARSPEDVLRVNTELVKPSELVVFTDDYHYCVRGSRDAQCIDYGGAEAVLRMLSIARPGDVIVNGAILDSQFSKYYEAARRLDSRLVGIADIAERLGSRDAVINGIPHTRVLHGVGPPLFKPLLAIVVNGRPAIDYINDVLSALNGVPESIRRCVDKEVVLGMYALMTGQLMVPWFPGAHRVGVDRPCSRRLSAYANYMFFKSLIRNGIYITGVNNYVMMMRYLLDALVHW